MTCSSPQQHRNNYRRQRCASSSRGFTLIELILVVAIAGLLSAITIPVIQSSLRYFGLRSAVSSFTGAIQSARYQAIFHGCSYQIRFSAAAYNYTVWNTTPAAAGGCTAAFVQVGGAVPLAGSGITLNENLTAQFSPSGLVQAITGTMTAANPITLTCPGLPVENITVSNYGNITVKP